MIFAEASGLPETIAGGSVAALILAVVAYFLRRSDDRETKLAERAEHALDEIRRDLAACHAREALAHVERASLAARLAVLETTIYHRREGDAT